MTIIPKIPPEKLLISIAYRFDHSFGLTADSIFGSINGHTPETRQILLNDLKKVYEVVVSMSTNINDNYVEFNNTIELRRMMARAYEPEFDNLSIIPEPGYLSTRHEQILLDMSRFIEELQLFKY